MPIERVGDFLVTETLGITPSVGIESSRITECIAEAKAKYSGIFGSPSFDFREDNLDFLKELPEIKQLWFWDCKLASIDGIYHLKDLEYCGVMDQRPGIDFSKFPRLKQVVAHWNPKDSGFAKSKINNFSLWHFNPRTKTFDGLVFPPRTTQLELTWLNPQSLEGLAPLPKLRELGIHRARNMTDLSLLPKFAPNLKRLIITGAKKVTDFTGIENHPMIELAIVDGHRVRDSK